jgi:hypothetical protein
VRVLHGAQHLQRNLPAAARALNRPANKRAGYSLTKIVAKICTPSDK